jgi:hypothetical protein
VLAATMNENEEHQAMLMSKAWRTAANLHVGVRGCRRMEPEPGNCPVEYSGQVQA